MPMQRVVILGRGGAGKSTFAQRLGALSGLPVVELDKHFWQPGLQPLSQDEWVEVQRKLASQSCWIMDGDLGPYDALSVRLSAADTVLLFDFPLWLCLWRVLRRSRENLDFWRWFITWGWLEQPKICAAITDYPDLKVHVFRSPKALDHFLSDISDAELNSGSACTSLVIARWRLFRR